MIALLDTPDDLAVCQAELGCPVGELLSPLTRRSLRGYGIWAADNGCFSGFDEKTFLSLLSRNGSSRECCKFVNCPDVVADARRTLEVFKHWHYKLAGWPVALTMQDGQENLEIPWEWIQAIFIGGSTAWKMSPHAANCIRTAKILGKWVHIGRINTPERYQHFEALGADSFDGTGIARYSWMRERLCKPPEMPTLFEVHDEETVDPDGEVVLRCAAGLVGAAPVMATVGADTEGPRAQAD